MMNIEADRVPQLEHSARLNEELKAGIDPDKNKGCCVNGTNGITEQVILRIAEVGIPALAVSNKILFGGLDV